MQSERLENYMQFMDYLEFPMVLFEQESGAVVKINYEAQTIIGKDVRHLSATPDKSHIEKLIKERLVQKHCIIWYRIQLDVDDRQYFVSGILNQFDEQGKTYCALMFESRGELRHGSVTLERAINHAGIGVICLYDQEGDWIPRYVSRNMDQFGYTSEQIYERQVSIASMLREDENARLDREMRAAFKKGQYDMLFYTTLYMENGDSRYVRMNIHMAADNYGKCYDADFLIYDLTEQQKEIEKNQYLEYAVTRSKSVVLVKRFTKDKRSLRFISSNANRLGCNVEAINRGDRLTEDYIHPEDRDEILDSMYSAIADSLEYVSFQYRMVGDDGKVRYVRNEIMTKYLSEDTCDVECLITDITEEKENEQLLIKQQRGIEKEMDFIMKGYERKKSKDIMELLQMETFSDLLESFSAVSGLYSALVDEDGQFLTAPVGPGQHIGAFYDLFERPAYKELYLQLNETIMREREPVILEMGTEYPEARLSGAPIILDDKYAATWVICSFDEKQAEKLAEVYRAHWGLTEHISNFLYNEAVVNEEVKRSRLNEMRLEHRRKQQEIVCELLAELPKNDSRFLHMILQKTGEHLGLSNVTCYAVNEERDTFIWEDEWNRKNQDKPLHSEITWKPHAFPVSEKILYEEGYLYLDESKSTLDIKKTLMLKPSKSMLIVPFFWNGRLMGVMTLEEQSGYRNWKDYELEFVMTIRDMAQEVFERRDGVGSLRETNTSLISAFDNMPFIMYVQDTKSGIIYFGNKCAEKVFGKNLKGVDGNRIVKCMDYAYKSDGLAGSRVVHNKKTSKWESYIKQLDRVMDVQTISVEWQKGKDARIVIMMEKTEKKEHS